MTIKTIKQQITLLEGDRARMSTLPAQRFLDTQLAELRWKRELAALAHDERKQRQPA